MTRQIEESKRIQQEFADREGVFTLTSILSETDLQGNILLANDKLCAVSKYSRNELIGKPYSIFRHPEMPEELFTTEWNTLRSGRVFHGIIKHKAKDGTHYWVDATIAPIKDEHGNVVKYTGAQYHLTDEATALELYNQQAKKMGCPVLESNHKESNGQRNGSLAKHNAL
jgi:PAS domain S-box-containing protein